MHGTSERRAVSDDGAVVTAETEPSHRRAALLAALVGLPCATVFVSLMMIQIVELRLFAAFMLVGCVAANVFCWWQLRATACLRVRFRLDGWGITKIVGSRVRAVGAWADLRQIDVKRRRLLFADDTVIYLSHGLGSPVASGIWGHIGRLAGRQVTPRKEIPPRFGGELPRTVALLSLGAVLGFPIGMLFAVAAGPPWHELFLLSGVASLLVGLGLAALYSARKGA